MRLVALHMVDSDPTSEIMKLWREEAAPEPMSVSSFTDLGDQPNPHNEALLSTVAEADYLLIQMLCAGSSAGRLALQTAWSADVRVRGYGNLPTFRRQIATAGNPDMTLFAKRSREFFYTATSRARRRAYVGRLRQLETEEVTTG